ncbi:ABC transporter substrate-binding protein [Bradyrhizobium sp. LHD-71]|uniref:heme/hemin ABC transporter substrate-binding protein n=1 Tax=Bradyrhizobium sp. LHD-71 TaxID=3072141 RepID=UPI00280E6B2D|nr:ABC transporter substrate-binding protein [Bradyrhizobium sp. LHD-71]MDQ8730934.1 ABC transporter substrate-binding protein [Bradyrhizobium sp. LHD-71]
MLVTTAVSAAGIRNTQAKRIITVGGALTEIVYALGLENRLVGIDTTSLYPPEALRQKPNVGYMRQLSAEGVLGLDPELIIVAEGSGPKETLAVLGEAKVPIVTVPESFSEAGILERIRVVARELGVEQRGECLSEAVTKDLAAMRKLRDQVSDKRRVMFVISFVNGRAMVAGRKTAAHEIIALAGGINAADNHDGYKPLSEEAIVAAKPDVVLVMQRGTDSISSETVFANAAFALTPAARDKSFIAMDGLYLLGFGPRTAAAARDLAVSLYPALAAKDEMGKPRVLSVNCRQ